MMKLKLSIGDVFRFAKSADTWSYGQILLSEIIQYIIIFEPVFKEIPTLEHIVSSPLLLCGWTSDARFYSGDWEIVENMPSREFTFPEYKVEISGKTWVTDVDGKPLRLATTEQARNLHFKSSNSPIAFEKAFKAYHGDLPWESRFEQLLCPRNIS
jgi:immunity protein 26 of polymorphic toxin system